MENTQEQRAQIMPKDVVRYITTNIQPDEVEYVTTVNNIANDCKDCDMTEKQTEDIIYVTKIIAFADKFRVLHWAACNLSYHKALDDFYDEIEEYKDAIAENIQAIIGQFKGKQFSALTLPLSDNPLEVINELKVCVTNWFHLHEDDDEYEGCRNATSGFLETIHKYIYLFRLCKTEGCSNC